MNEQIIDLNCQVAAHHETGPSKLENYDPRSGGCYAFLPSLEGNEKADFGTLKHTALSTRNLSVLGGDTSAEGEVRAAIEFIDSFQKEYPVFHRELTLKTEKIFGTLDHLGLDQAMKKAVIIDGKFGAWSVTPAQKNLQGWAYVLLVFLNFPTVNKIKVIFYAAKTQTYSEATFWRNRLPRLERRIYKIVDQAKRAKENPLLTDYTPDAVNCSFCLRLNCPARLALMGTLVSQWTRKPVNLPHLNLLQVTTPQLAQLKSLSNVFKTFSAAVDAEAKRRAFDENDVVEGYEIAEKSGIRTVVGANNITEASKVLGEVWEALGFKGADWGDYVMKNVELSIADLEKQVGKMAPYGKASLAKKMTASWLEKAGLVNAGKIFYLQAIKE